jgi:dihydroflavonol-4-reductase
MILVTGAAGHLGNVLVRELVNRGKQVRALILPGEDTQSLSDMNIEIIEGNILDYPSVIRAMENIEEVYHLAGLVSISPGNEALLHKVNVEGTCNMLNAAKECGVKRFVYTSSIHALARPPKGVVIDENQPFDANNPAGMYDATKAEASLHVLEAARQGLHAVIVCPTGVIGPYDFRRSELGEMMLTWMKKSTSVIVEGEFDFVDVRDVANGHILACEKGTAGQTYILGGTHIKVRSLVEMVKQIANAYSPIIVLPTKLAHGVARIAEWFYKITHTRPRLTRYSLETLLSNSDISSQKAQRELGYQPRHLAETIKDTITWWKTYARKIKSTLRA